jgi:hypothetical protein
MKSRIYDITYDIICRELSMISYTYDVYGLWYHDSALWYDNKANYDI